MRWRLYTRLRRVIRPLCCVGICLLVLHMIGMTRLIQQLMADPAQLSFFTHNVQRFCGGNFEAYVHKFARLKMVVLDPRRSDGKPGGEELDSVMHQPEYVEYFEFQPGYFEVPCSQIPSYRFRDDHHLNLWMSVLQPADPTMTSEYLRVRGDSFVHKPTTIAVTRYEYANLYHQLVDLYSAYIMLRVFDLDPESTDILIVDGHPKSTLDEIWNTLFGDVIRAGHLDNNLLFPDLIWGLQGYTSPMHKHSQDKIPEISSFSDFVLRRHGLKDTKKPNCMDLLVLFVWRRNYVAHPRNPSGVVARKILNEKEVISFVQDNLLLAGKPMGRVKGIHLDSLPFSEQLKHIREADILVGMHGAGLSHTLFLPQHAGLIEIFSSTKLTVNHHFKALARWRGLHYESYVNIYPSKDINTDDIDLEPYEISQLVMHMKDKICETM